MMFPFDLIIFLHLIGSGVCVDVSSMTSNHTGINPNNSSFEMTHAFLCPNWDTAFQLYNNDSTRTSLSVIINSQTLTLTQLISMDKSTARMNCPLNLLETASFVNGSTVCNTIRRDKNAKKKTTTVQRDG